MDEDIGACRCDQLAQAYVGGGAEPEHEPRSTWFWNPYPEMVARDWGTLWRK